MVRFCLLPFSTDCGCKATTALQLDCEGVAKAVSDQSSELRGKLMQAQESPERDAVEQLLQDFQQNPEGIGIIEFATFGAEVETAVQDGNVDGDELQAIQSKYDEIRTK